LGSGIRISAAALAKINTEATTKDTKGTRRKSKSNLTAEFAEKSRGARGKPSGAKAVRKFVRRTRFQSTSSVVGVFAFDLLRVSLSEPALEHSEGW
jgi:hypothetical protein